ncbi:CLUMA_CG018253, isoform A, partial [Clunio marinus]
HINYFPSIFATNFIYFLNKKRFIRITSNDLKMAFNLTRTLCARSFLNNPALYKTPLSSSRNVSIKVIPQATSLAESHDEKNLRLKRPQSPHLTIYKPQLTSMLSITHRGTGIALTGYAAIFGLATLACPEGANAVVNLIEGLQLGAASLAALKFTLAFPFAFHTVNGIRHLFWDLGRFLTIKEVYTTGYIMVAISTILAIALTAM